MTDLVSESEPYRGFKNYLIPSGLFNQQEKEPLTNVLTPNPPNWAVQYSYKMYLRELNKLQPRKDMPSIRSGMRK